MKTKKKKKKKEKKLGLKISIKDTVPANIYRIKIFHYSKVKDSSLRKSGQALVGREEGTRNFLTDLDLVAVSAVTVCQFKWKCRFAHTFDPRRLLNPGSEEQLGESATPDQLINEGKSIRHGWEDMSGRFVKQESEQGLRIRAINKMQGRYLDHNNESNHHPCLRYFRSSHGHLPTMR